MKTVIRTCIGCRQRVDATKLVRIITENTAESTSGNTAGNSSGQWRAVVDYDGTKPGRGAYLHPDPVCLQQAIRRRAFGRALRVQGQVEPPHAAELAARQA